MANNQNQLFFGDNLDVLRQRVDDESVDLIYLDPPFNSNADYNVLFAEQDGSTGDRPRSRRSTTPGIGTMSAATAFERFTVKAPHEASQAPPGVP